MRCLGLPYKKLLTSISAALYRSLNQSDATPAQPVILEPCMYITKCYQLGEKNGAQSLPFISFHFISTLEQQWPYVEELTVINKMQGEC